MHRQDHEEVSGSSNDAYCDDEASENKQFSVRLEWSGTAIVASVKLLDITASVTLFDIVKMKQLDFQEYIYMSRIHVLYVTRRIITRIVNAQA